MLFGIINLNKPKGLTSHQVVARIRKILKVKQVGHTGTLDPLAVGVLPVCVGKATRIIQYLDTSKAYKAHILLGTKTDTYDTEGTIIEQQSVTPDKEQIEALLEQFKGEITQRPPIYSAVHYKGKRLYEYARKNIEISDIPQRKVTINDIKLVGIEDSTVIVDIDCSGGTYIRSIAHDLGEMLGYGACLEGLTRTRSGKFKLEDSFTLEEIEINEPDKILMPPQKALDFALIEINDDQKHDITLGRSITPETNYNEGTMLQLVNNDILIAVAKIKENRIQPVNVLVDLS